MSNGVNLELKSMAGNPWARFLFAGLIAGVVIAVAAGTSRTPTLAHNRRPAAPALRRIGGDEPPLRAEAVLITRLKSGEILYQRGAVERLPIASLTKLMTALIFAESTSPLEEVEFSGAAKSVGKPEDKRSGIKAGERIRAEDVLKLLLASSDSDAAYAAAEHAARNIRPELTDAPFPELIAAFVERMNLRSTALGLTNTHFANPAGTDDPENYSTARDLTALVAAITRDHAELWTASRIPETFIFSADGERHGVVNTDPLLLAYPALYGSKTGFETDAQGALVLLYLIAREDPAAIVILRSPDRFTDGREALHWLESDFAVDSK